MLLPKRFTFRLSLVLVMNTLAGAMFFLASSMPFGMLQMYPCTDGDSYHPLVAYLGFYYALCSVATLLRKCTMYPFPSGRVAAEVLMSNEGSKAKTHVSSGLIALIYDFILNSLWLVGRGYPYYCI